MSRKNKRKNDGVRKHSSQVDKSLTKLDELKEDVDVAILKIAKDFVPKLHRQPEIMPLRDGGLQFEYDRDDGAYLEFELHSNSKVKMFFTNFIDCEQNIDIDCNVDEINNKVESFFKKTK